MMSGIVRKRKSQWDSKEEANVTAKTNEDTAGPDPRWSDLEDNSALKLKDSSGLPSWEEEQENCSKKDNSINRDINEIAATTQPRDGDKSHCTSPGFNELGRENPSRSTKSTRSLSSRRYQNRSRSRSRSRSGGRSRSRSRDRGPKSRSRSRSRDRDDRRRSQSRNQSRSPLRDRDHRRESSYGGGWSDRKTGPGSSLQPCKDFPVGKCRRGSQCRFMHQQVTNNPDQRNAEQPEKDHTDRWRSRQEYAPSDKISDGSGNPQSALPCNDFIRGKCHRGSSCRYPHHDAASGNNDYDRRGGNESFDNNDNKLRHTRRGGGFPPPPCRFFAMGKCHRDDCRFSHDPVSGDLERRPRGDDNRFSHDPVSGDLERRPRGDDNSDLGDRNKLWNGPKWGDEEDGNSDAAKSTGWGGNSDYKDPRPTDNDAGGSISDVRKTGTKSTGWGGISDAAKSTGISDAAKSTGWGGNSDYKDPRPIDNDAGGSISDVRKTGTTDWGVGNAGNVKVTKGEKPSDERRGGGGRNYSGNGNNNNNGGAANAVISESPAPGVVARPSNGQNPALIPPPPSIQPYETVASNNIIPLAKPGIIAHKVMASEPEPVNQTPSNISASLMQMFGNGQLPQLYAALNLPNTTGGMAVPSLPNSASAAAALPPVVSLDSVDPPAAAATTTTALMSSAPCPPPTVEVDDPVKSKKSGGGGGGSGEAEEPREKPIAVAENKKKTEEKEEQNNVVNPENADDGGKAVAVGEGVAEKDMRLFKIALVEFVKEILKPRWKEGQISREVHKTIVKKVVDKVTSTIQAIHVPKTQEKIDQYLDYSKPKITKLVEAYVERFLKT